MTQSRKIRKRSLGCWLSMLACAVCGVSALAQQGSAKAETPREVMWLLDLARYKAVGMCGNSGEFDWPAQFGIVINGDGEILERCPDSVWVATISDGLVLVTRRESAGAIPLRTLIGDNKRVSIRTDLRPRAMGCGWVMFDQGGLFSRSDGVRTNHVLDASSGEGDALFYLDDRLEAVGDIAAELGLDLGGDRVIGMMEPWGYPVVEDRGTRRQRYIHPDGTRSRQGFLNIDFDRRRLDHPGLVEVLASGERWLYDPVDERRVFSFWYGVNLGAGLHAYKSAEGSPAIVYDDALNELGRLGDRIQPLYATSEGIVVCNDRSHPEPREDVFRGRIPRAYRVDTDRGSVDTGGRAGGHGDGLTELDVSWIKWIEHPAGVGVSAVRNHDDELVLIDAGLDPIVNLGAAVDLKHITRSGRVLVLDRQTGVYSLFDARGVLIRSFDVPAILGE